MVEDTDSMTTPQPPVNTKTPSLFLARHSKSLTGLASSGVGTQIGIIVASVCKISSTADPALYGAVLSVVAALFTWLCVYFAPENVTEEEQAAVGPTAK
jgi:hypothetical protein